MEKLWKSHRVAFYVHRELLSETAHFSSQIYLHAIQRFVNRNESNLCQYIMFGVPYWKPIPLIRIKYLAGSPLSQNYTWRLEQSFGWTFWHKIFGRLNNFLSLTIESISFRVSVKLISNPKRIPLEIISNTQIDRTHLLLLLRL